MADKITAPYNFVPVSSHVYFPEWASKASQDVPFKDGISGTIEFAIEALTPIYVRGANTSFFSTPDGIPAIPGSSTRGLLRNVVEIAGFGKLSNVNDHRYGVRDLQNRQVYGEHMSAIVEGNLVPLVCSGWLEQKKGERETPAQIVPCSFAKIEYPKLVELARTDGREFDPGRRQGAKSKYGSWGKRLDVWVGVQPQIKNGERGRIGDYGVVEKVALEKSADASVQGRLVFTGQPMTWSEGEKRKKHHDFVFYGCGEKPESLAIDRRAFEDFEFIHSDRGQQGRLSDKPNEEWGYWKERFKKGEPVPVFYLLEGGKVRAFGLAMMFRLAYRKTTLDAVRNAQPDSGSSELDLAETVFGRVHQKDTSLKGRISIGLARLQDRREHPAGDPVRMVLGAPKPSFYPAYLEQDPPVPPWKTYMDEDVRARGWKRYRPQDANPSPPIPPGAGKNVMSEFRPLPAGSTFQGRIRIHNLRPVELGAVLWALDFGAAKERFHSLGMARPYGYGRIRLSRRSHACRDMQGEAVDLEVCRKAFEDAMEGWAREEKIDGGWKDSIQLRELLACAHPIPAGSSEGSYLSLQDHPEAKKRGWVLAPAGDPGARTPREDGDRGAPQGGNPGPKAPGVPRPKDKVKAVLLEKRTNKGGWRACYKLLDLSGPIQNPGEVPPEKRAGEEVDLIVSYCDPTALGDKKIAFKWPPASEPQRESKRRGKGRG